MRYRPQWARALLFVLDNVANELTIFFSFRHGCALLLLFCLLGSLLQ
jgi:hypothetical protein